MNVKFCDLGARNDVHRTALVEAVAAVIASGRYILGPAVERFEREWAAYCGAPHAIGVASGTDAIALALRAEGVRPGDHVIVPAATSIATFHAVSAIGAFPVPVDVDDDGNIDVCAASHAITNHTRAIVPVHLYGRACDLAAIHALASNAGLAVVVDAAQGHGLQVVGTTAFSFYPTKNLGALGDGGIVVTNSPKVDAFVRDRRSLGGGPGGLNSRLDEMQAAILSALLPDLGEDNARRAAVAAHYEVALKGANVQRPRHTTDFNVWHQYVIRHPRRDELRDELGRRGIETGCHYPTPPHFAYGHESGTCPKAEALFAECLSLPMGPEVTAGDVLAVAAAVHAVAGEAMGLAA